VRWPSEFDQRRGDREGARLIREDKTSFTTGTLVYKVRTQPIVRPGFDRIRFPDQSAPYKEVDNESERAQVCLKLV